MVYGSRNNNSFFIHWGYIFWFYQGRAIINLTLFPMEVKSHRFVSKYITFSIKASFGMHHILVIWMTLRTLIAVLFIHKNVVISFDQTGIYLAFLRLVFIQQNYGKTFFLSIVHYKASPELTLRPIQDFQSCGHTSVRYIHLYSEKHVLTVSRMGHIALLVFVSKYIILCWIKASTDNIIIRLVIWMTLNCRTTIAVFYHVILFIGMISNHVSCKSQLLRPPFSKPTLMELYGIMDK